VLPGGALEVPESAERLETSLEPGPRAYRRFDVTFDVTEDVDTPL
jgi:hypothetical protein